MRFGPKPRLRALLMLLAAAAAALVVAACGGSDDKNDEDAQALLEQAFKKPIKSADMTLDMSFKADGVEQLKDPVRVKLSGPFQSNGEGKVPILDFDLSVQGGGQSITAGLGSTGENAWVSFRGTDYEVGEETVARYARQLETAAKQNKDKTLSDFGVDPSSWVTGASKEGDENVAGAATEHVSGDVDVAKMLDDLNKLVDRAGSLGVQNARPQKLTEDQQKQVEDIVKDPKFDVYVGKDDDIVRRVSVDLNFEVPEDDRSKAGGLEGGSLTFDLQFANIGGDQRVEEPRNAKPLSELTQQIGGLGALGGLGGAGGAGGSGSGGGTTTTPAPGAGGSTPDADAFQKYSDCVAKAGGTDQAAIQKCADLLK